jgi:RNA polymerase sigma-70 factor (ECF subfamily)
MIHGESFINELKKGAPAAYEVFVEMFEGPLYRFFYCDHRDHHLAQEQTAETFAQLVQSIRRMRGGAEQLRAFVFATARHVQLRRFRERNRCTSSLADELDVADVAPSPATAAAEREQVERVLDAIGQLDEPLRNVLLLRFVEGCSLEEVAEALEMPLGTVKSHIHRGRERLKQLFAEWECET